MTCDDFMDRVLVVCGDGAEYLERGKREHVARLGEWAITYRADRDEGSQWCVVSLTAGVVAYGVRGTLREAWDAASAQTTEAA